MIARRLVADLSLAFPDIAVVFDDSGQLAVRGGLSGVAGLVIDSDDELTDADVEKATALAMEDVADNLWPDTQLPWPPCPSHRDHPLQPKLVRGRARWICLRGDDFDIPIGRLGAR